MGTVILAQFWVKLYVFYFGAVWPGINHIFGISLYIHFLVWEGIGTVLGLTICFLF